MRHYVDKIQRFRPSRELTNSITLSDYNTRPPFNFLFAYSSDSRNPDTWKTRFNKVENKTELALMTIILDIATTIMFPNPADRSEFKCLTFAVRESDIVENGDSSKILCTDEPNMEKTFNGSTYYSINHLHQSKYLVAMPERALLNFLIAKTDLLEEIPKHQYFNIRKYLDGGFNNASVI